MGSSSKVVLGLVLGGMMAIDMGGPFNKAAYVFGTAAIAAGNYDIMAYTLGDYVRMRRLTLAGEELLSTELVWAPVLFILRKGGKNVILIEESNIERKTL